MKPSSLTLVTAHLSLEPPALPLGEQQLETLPKQRPKTFLRDLSDLFGGMELAKMHEKDLLILQKGSELDELIDVNMAASPGDLDRLSIIEKSTFHNE